MTETALITGATGGIGAVYADRLARRGYDLLLVARNESRLSDLAAKIHDATGRKVDVLVADVTKPEELATVEDRLRTDSSIELLVNSAGSSWFASTAGADPAKADDQIALNVTSVVRLSLAAATAFAGRGHGTIVNFSSALAVHLLPVSAVYSGTKSFVLTFTLGLHEDLAAKGVRVQAVVPGALDTGIWDGSGIELGELPKEMVMPVGEAVDAALAGLDSGELVTIPSMHDIEVWNTYAAARAVLAQNVSLSTPAERYKVA